MSTLAPKLKLALNGGNKNQAAEQREPEKYWLNIGEFAEYEDETGEVVRQFIGLNYGIPLTSVPAMKKSSNPHWNAICDAKDGLHQQLMELAQKLEPGETLEFPITVQLRHVGEAPEVAAEDNPFRVKLRV